MALPGVNARSEIVEASIASLPGEESALSQAAGWTLQQTAVVDTRHLVLVFHVDHSSPIMGGGVPAQLTKYSDIQEHAPYRAECLKLATLRHYRESHRDLEGTWDPMEGKSRIASTLEEMLKMHGVQTVPHGAHLVSTEVTYAAEDTNLVFCTTRECLSGSRPAQWKIASRIRDVPGLALSLGAEFARQRDDGWHASITGLDYIVDAVIRVSGLESVVHVYHGPVVYDDSGGETLFKRIPGPARGLAAHFFKRTIFQGQQEYRFVLSSPGGRPVEDEFFLEITPDLRRVFQIP